MKKFKNSLTALVGLTALAVAIPLLMPFVGLGSNTSGGSAPTNQTQNVLVVNTAQQPVPVTGSATVTGTVNLATGTAVGINGTVGLDSQNNTVKIDSSSPVPVRDADNPARQPFQTELDFFEADGSYGATQSFTVPANKRLVIEYVSADSGVPVGELTRIGISTEINGQYQGHHVVANRLGAVGNGDDEFVAGQPMTVYADPGTDVFVGFSRNNAVGFANCFVTISGHFVDIP